MSWSWGELGLEFGLGLVRDNWGVAIVVGIGVEIEDSWGLGYGWRELVSESSGALGSELGF